MSSTAAKPVETALTSDDWRPFPFRWVLPLAQLLVCAVLLWPYRAWIGFELFGIAPRYSTIRTPQSTPSMEFTMNADGKLAFPPDIQKRMSANENAFDTVASLNAPVIFFDALYSIFSGDPRELKPRHIYFKTWRAVTWPVFALPFWWMAGRGAEALASARRKLLLPRLRWPETVASFLLMTGGLFLGLVFFSSNGPDRAAPSLRLFATASGMWGLLGSLTVVAKLAQWRIKKKTLAIAKPAQSV